MARIDFQEKCTRIEDACIDWQRYALDRVLPPPPMGLVTRRGQTLTGDAALEYVKNEVDLSDTFMLGLDASGVEWSGRQLMGATFVGTRLARASFRGADLHHSDFVCCDLEDTDFCGAELDWAEFTSCFAKNSRWSVSDDPNVRVSFERCELRESNIALLGAGARLWKCDLDSDSFTTSSAGHLVVVCDRTGRRLGPGYVPEERWPERTETWSLIDLEGGYWFGANCRRRDMGEASLTGAVLSCADLRSTGLDNSWYPDLSGAPRLFGALCDELTQFPKGFDAKAAGVILV